MTGKQLYNMMVNEFKEIGYGETRKWEDIPVGYKIGLANLATKLQIKERSL